VVPASSENEYSVEVGADHISTWSIIRPILFLLWCLLLLETGLETMYIFRLDLKGLEEQPQLTPCQETGVRWLFSIYDQNDDGLLSTGELLYMAQTTGDTADASDIDLIIKKFGTQPAHSSTSTGSNHHLEGLYPQGLSAAYLKMGTAVLLTDLSTRHAHMLHLNYRTRHNPIIFPGRRRPNPKR